MKTLGVLVLALVLGLTTSVHGEGEPDLENPDARAAIAVLDSRISIGAWADAFAAARTLLEKRGGEPVARTDTLAVPARVLLRERLGALSAEGRAAFERIYAGEAARKLEEVRALPSAAALEDTGTRFFPLDEGARALLLAGDRHFERGNLAFAVALWRDVALLHPIPARRAEAFARLQAALLLLGSPSVCRELAAACWNQGEQEQGARLAALVSACDAAIDDLALDPSGNVAPVASLAVPLGGLAVHCVSEARYEREVVAHGTGFPLLTASPAGLEGGLVLLHLGRAVIAYDPLANKKRWRHGTQHIERHFAALLRTRLTLRLGATCAAGKVLATLETDALAEDTPRATLVALDARTGKLVWDVLDTDPDERFSLDENETHPRLSFTGTPLVAGTRVFCGATDARSSDATWLACCDADTGAILWKRALLSAPLRRMRFGPGNPAQIARIPAPVCAMAAGSLVVCSENGLIAAFDPTDGRLLWERSYASYPVTRVGPENDNGANPNPILAVGGFLVVGPGDGHEMFILRPLDGKLVASNDLISRHQILGVSQGRLVVASASSLRALRICEGPGGLAQIWWNTLHVDGRLPGRGLVTTSAVLVATRDGIEAFDPDSGASTATVPWRDSEHSGDLLVVKDRLAAISVLHVAFGD
jgi:outer membrane protein assembly factor BamB